MLDYCTFQGDANLIQNQALVYVWPTTPAPSTTQSTTTPTTTTVAPCVTQMCPESMCKRDVRQQFLSIIWMST